MDKNIQEALKWIYASLGGDITDLAAVDDITAILNAIAALDTVKKISGAKELPAVSSTDNGDVLTVVEGEWDKAAPSGGSDLPDTPAQDGTYTLTNTVSSGTGTLSWGSGGGDVIIVNDVDGTLDKTWQEIFDLLTQGKQIVSIYAEGDGYVTQYPLLHAKYTVGDENPYSVLGLSCDNPPSVGYVTYTADSADSYPEYQDS